MQDSVVVAYRDQSGLVAEVEEIDEALERLEVEEPIRIEMRPWLAVQICNTSQHVATRRNTSQHVATCFGRLRLPLLFVSLSLCLRAHACRLLRMRGASCMRLMLTGAER